MYLLSSNIFLPTTADAPESCRVRKTNYFF